MNTIILLPILLSFFFGVRLILIKNIDTQRCVKYSLISTVLIAISTVAAVVLCYGKEIEVLRFNDTLHLSFKVDALGAIFALMVSFLWIPASVYASQYMTHEGGMKRFFECYIITFGTVIGIAFSGNMLSIYLFYEVLTFVTLPLVVHKNEPRFTYAGSKYIMYSVAGASVSFAGMMIYMLSVGDWEFTHTVMDSTAQSSDMYLAYFLMFIGFSVKTGLFPMHGWLISAGVAPTPVTALLHAVAVVKSGAFVVMRVTYYLFDHSVLIGSWAHYAAMAMAIITILFGSSMAMKNKHLKRRFAYSTVSQLSYILLGITAMSFGGLVAAVFHMLFHAVIKIVIFYSAGNAYYANHKEYVSDIEGYGSKMKLTFITFTISSIALIGIPPFGGFYSKFAVAESAVAVGGYMGFFAVVALMISALLTAMYLLQIAVLAFVPHDDFDNSRLSEVKEAPKKMTIPMVLITGTMILMSLFSAPLYNLIHDLLMGGF